MKTWRGIERDEAWLAAICATPDDDTPRLVYADHLLERGDWRGELIVAQCELARLPRRSDAWRRAKARERELLDRRGEDPGFRRCGLDAGAQAALRARWPDVAFK